MILIGIPGSPVRVVSFKSKIRGQVLALLPLGFHLIYKEVITESEVS